VFSAIQPRELPLRGLGPRTLLRIVEALLVVVLAVQAARLVWLVLTPTGPLGAPVAARTADLSALARFDPFFRGGAVAAGTELASADAAAATNLKLHGVRTSLVGDDGSAIIAGADGRHASYAVGDEVAPGITLEAVRSDHVTLKRGAERLRLAFQPTTGQPAAQPVASATAAPASAPASQAVDPGRLIADAAPQPRMTEGRVNGVRLQGAGESLRAAGLQPGDVLLSVNGTPLDSPDRLKDLQDQMAKAPETEVRFERAGQILTARIRTARP
jgi:general secretion pathway protein C